MRAVDAGPDEWGIVGVSPAIEDVREKIRTFGPTDRNVLILGPTGTGKELVAKAFHKEFGRGPFLVANAAGFSSTLVESQLFGHLILRFVCVGGRHGPRPSRDRELPIGPT